MIGSADTMRTPIITYPPTGVESSSEVRGYTCQGNVRGWCGHIHRTLTAAEVCQAADSRAMHRLGGGSYSDRGVYALEPATNDACMIIGHVHLRDIYE